MSDIPTASTSAASTSSASTSQTMPYTFDNQCPLRDLDYTTTEESDISSDESEMIDDELSYSNHNICKLDPIIDDNMDDTSWSSTASSNTSYGDKSSSENSETESILKELIRESWTLDKSTTNQDNSESFISPILILVQVLFEFITTYYHYNMTLFKYCVFRSNNKLFFLSFLTTKTL